MGSDQAVLPTAQLAERLGLPGLPVETARTVADKRRMRAAFEKRKVRCPKGREASSFEEAEQAFHQLGAPVVVVKPVDGSAQRGVTEVRAEGELADAVDRALGGLADRRARARAVPRRRRVHRQRLPARAASTSG